MNLVGVASVCYAFCCKKPLSGRPASTGPDSLPLSYLKAKEVGKGDALRQETGLFCILFVAAWTKRMASGGTRPAGYTFDS